MLGGGLVCCFSFACTQDVISLTPPCLAIHPTNKYTAHKVVVFSKSYCPYASKAKQTLQSEGAVFHVVELDQRADGSTIQAALADMTGRRTVPNVFIGGKNIGGADDTVNGKACVQWIG